MTGLTEDLGPLPVWAWGLIGGSALVAVMYWRKMATATTGAATVAPVEAAAGDWTPTDSLPLSSGASTVTASIDTVDSWMASAVKLLGDAGLSPLDAQVALQKFFNGGTLTTKEASIVDKALALKGTPPTSFIPPVSIETPTVPVNYYLPSTYTSFSRPGHSSGDDTIYGLTTTGERRALSYAEWVSANGGRKFQDG